MIVVKVELWPMGNAARARELCRMAVWNLGQGAEGLYDYGVAIAKSAHHGAKSAGVWRAGKVLGYPRRARRVGVWDLLRSALNAALDGRPTYEGEAKRPEGAARVVRSLDGGAE